MEFSLNWILRKTATKDEWVNCFHAILQGCPSNGKTGVHWRYIDIHKDTLEEEDEEVEKTALEDSAQISDASPKVDLHLLHLIV